MAYNCGGEVELPDKVQCLCRFLGGYDGITGLYEQDVPDCAQVDIPADRDKKLTHDSSALESLLPPL